MLRGARYAVRRADGEYEILRGDVEMMQPYPMSPWEIVSPKGAILIDQMLPMPSLEELNRDPPNNYYHLPRLCNRAAAEAARALNNAGENVPRLEVLEFFDEPPDNGIKDANGRVY